MMRTNMCQTKYGIQGKSSHTADFVRQQQHSIFPWLGFCVCKITSGGQQWWWWRGMTMQSEENAWCWLNKNGKKEKFIRQIGRLLDVISDDIGLQIWFPSTVSQSKSWLELLIAKPAPQTRDNNLNKTWINMEHLANGEQAGYMMSGMHTMTTWFKSLVDKVHSLQVRRHLVHHERRFMALKNITEKATPDKSGYWDGWEFM